MKADSRLRGWSGALCRERVHLDIKSQVFNHAPDFCGRLAWSGEIPIHKHGICRIERQGLQAAQVMLAAAGDTKFRARVKKAE